MYLQAVALCVDGSTADSDSGLATRYDGLHKSALDEADSSKVLTIVSMLSYPSRVQPCDHLSYCSVDLELSEYHSNAVLAEEA